MKSNNEKVAIITGAGSGIGRAATLALLRAGYAVSLAGRHLETLEETLRMGKGLESRALIIETDVRDYSSVKELFSKTYDTFGRIDTLFNNAGVGAPPIPFSDLSLEQWTTVVDTNLTGTFLCAQEAFKIMMTQHPMGGRIINNGSISAHAPRPNSAPYTSTKHAVTGLTKSISLDGRKYNIACSQIDIGNAETDLTTPMRNGILQPYGSTQIEPTFEVEHAANAVLLIADLPLNTNVQFMTLMATAMPYIGRG